MRGFHCNILSRDLDTNTSDLVDILDMYDLTQLITEPTRITTMSQTLTDLLIIYVRVAYLRVAAKRSGNCMHSESHFGVCDAILNALFGPKL